MLRVGALRGVGLMDQLFASRGMCTFKRYTDFKPPFEAHKLGLFRNQDVARMHDRTRTEMKRKLKVHVVVCVHLTLNNTKASVCNIGAQTLFSMSAGSLGFSVKHLHSCLVPFPVLELLILIS